MGPVQKGTISVLNMTCRHQGQCTHNVAIKFMSYMCSWCVCWQYGQHVLKENSNNVIIKTSANAFGVPMMCRPKTNAK